MKHEIKYVPDEYLQPESWATDNVLSSSYFEHPMTEPSDTFNLQDIKFSYVYKDVNPLSVQETQVQKNSTKKPFSNYSQEDKANFETYLNLYGDPKYNDWFRKMAALESAFVQKPKGNKSYCGWFQINKNYLSYYTNKPDITKDEFLNSPQLQFTAAKNLANEMLTNIKKNKIIMAWAKKHKYTEWDLLAGCWLGGFSNLRNYIYSGKDFEDANGTKLSDRINNYKNLQI